MASEIKLTTQLNWSRGGAQIIAKVESVEDQVGTTAIENVQIVANTSEQIDLGDVTDPSHLFFKNENRLWSKLSTVEKSAYTSVNGDGGKSDYETKNTVHVGIVTPAVAATAVYSLKPGQGNGTITAQAAWYAITDTDNVYLLVVATQR